ncbi:6108_t:CDS:1, partial [Dentiscutata erythropus]
DLENGVLQTETHTPNDATIETEPGANFIASDEEACRTEDNMVDDVLADTEPESLFLFR